MTTDGKNLVLVPGHPLALPQSAMQSVVSAASIPSVLSDALAAIREAATPPLPVAGSVPVPVASLVADLENYLGLHSVQQILRSLGLPSAKSWSQLKGVVVAGIKQKPELHQKLLDAVVMQQVCDLKSVAYYPVGDESAGDIIKAIQSISVPESDLARAYPLRVAEDVLSRDNGELKPISVFSDEFGCGVVLGRKRIFTISEDVSSANFNDALKEAFPDAEKIVTVKTVARQTYDVLYFNVNSNLLELRADVMRDATDAQTSKQMKKSNDDLRLYSVRMLSGAVPGLAFGPPVNMFPLTSKIYADRSGAIKKLGFVTETESMKRETMKAGVDLREELFHKSGATAIDHKMSIFEVAIQWSGDEVVGGINGSKPEIHVPGKYRDYVGMNRRVDYILVRGVRTYADANFIVSKINSYRK